MNAQEVKAKNHELKVALERLITKFMEETGHVPELNIYMNDHETVEGTHYYPDIEVTSYVK